ncbi:MAG: hypothetical protein VX777_06025 [Chlamydiota bacterium]|nr:hypothetical protein [Chlamydiota bacterium]
MSLSSTSGVNTSGVNQQLANQADRLSVGDSNKQSNSTRINELSRESFLNADRINAAASEIAITDPTVWKKTENNDQYEEQVDRESQNDDDFVSCDEGDDEFFSCDEGDDDFVSCDEGDDEFFSCDEGDDGFMSCDEGDDEFFSSDEGADELLLGGKDNDVVDESEEVFHDAKDRGPSLLSRVVNEVADFGKAVIGSVVNPSEYVTPVRPEHSEKKSQNASATEVRNFDVSDILPSTINSDDGVISVGPDLSNITAPSLPSGADALNYMAGTGIGQYFVENSRRVRDAAGYALIGTTDFQKMVDEERQELGLITGNPRLAKAIEAFAPKFAAMVKKEITGGADKKGMFPGFATYLERESKYFETIITGILLRVSVNFAKDTKRKVVEANPDFRGELTDEIFKDMLKIAYPEFDKVGEAYDEINRMAPGLEKQEALKKLFTPMASVFLEIAFPNGKDDLGIKDTVTGLPGVAGVASAVWSAVGKGAIPEILAKFYELAVKPAHHNASDLEILEQPGGRALKAFAEFAGQQGKNIIPALAKEKKVVIAEAVIEKMTEDPEKYNWLKGWIGDRLESVADSEDPIFQRIWSSAQGNIESILIHALATLAKDADGNLIPAVGSKGLTILDNFINENKDQIEQVYERVKALPEKQRNKELTALFKPLSDQLLEITDLMNNPLVQVVKGEAMPAVLRDFYFDMYRYQNDVDQFKGRLMDAIIDPEALMNQSIMDIADTHNDVVNNPSEAKDIIYNRADVSKAADELKSLCGVFSEDITSVVRNFIENDREQIVEIINKGMFDGKLSPQELREFGEGVNQFMSSGSDELNHTWDYAQSMIEATIFKVLTVVAENNPVEGAIGRTENKNKMMASNIVRHVLSILGDKIPEIDARIKEIDESNVDDKTKQKQKFATFQPLAEEFLGLVGENLNDVLPVPNAAKQILVEKLKTLFLPAIFNEVYSDLNGYRNNTSEYVANLNNLYGVDEAGKNGVTTFTDKLLDYIKDFVPYYMETNQVQIANVIDRVGGKYFDALTPEHQVEVKNIIERNVQAIGLSDEMKESSAAISEYLKGYMLKSFSAIGEKMNGVDPLTATIKVLSVTGDHVRRINKIPTKKRLGPAWLVPHNKMLSGFNKPDECGKAGLHAALEKDLDPNTTEEERNQQRIDFFYRQFGKDMIEILGMSKEDFPVPAPMRDEMWGLLQEKILPEMMMNIFKEFMRPKHINTIMSSAIDALKSEVDDMDTGLIKGSENEQLTPQEIELNKAIGGLIKEMLDMVPEFWTQTIFKSDKIKNMTAETVGRIVRKKLGEKTMNEYLNDILGGIDLPKADADRGKTEERKRREDLTAELELKKKLTSYISSQAKSAFKAVVKSKWNSFQDSFDKLVNKVFGKPGLAVKHFLDDIFHFIVFSVIGKVVNFVVFKLVWFFVDMKIATKSQEVIKDMHMKINENAVYKYCEAFVDMMKGTTAPEDVEASFIEEERLHRLAREREEREIAEAELANRLKDGVLKAEVEDDKKNQDILNDQRKVAGQQTQILV